MSENYKFAVADTRVGTDELLSVLSTGFVLMMQIGNAFLVNGFVRKKNTITQNFMNISSMAVEIIVWWLWGYGLAFG